MDLFQAIETGYDRYSDFKGRASRSEFWYFAAFAAISSVILNLIYLYNTDLIWFVLLIQLFVFTIPHLAVFARRLHDINKSGWWYLLFLTVIGTPILLYWLCLKGDPQKNKYGAPIKIAYTKYFPSKNRPKKRSVSKNSYIQIDLNKNAIIYAFLFGAGLLIIFQVHNLLSLFRSGSTHSLSSVGEYYCPTKDDMFVCSSACQYKWNTGKDDKIIIDVSSNSIVRYKYAMNISTGTSELMSSTLSTCFFKDRNNWTCSDDYQNEYTMKKGRYSETFFISPRPLYICFSDGIFNIFK
jgi:uncharacterized membrane protein YhaH (DUF805 family)